MLGSLAALLADHFHESGIVAAGLLAILGVIIAGHRFLPQPDPQYNIRTARRTSRRLADSFYADRYAEA